MKANFAQKYSRLTDKKGIPISDLIISANTNDIKTVTDIIDNAIIKRNFLCSFFDRQI